MLSALSTIGNDLYSVVCNICCICNISCVETFEFDSESNVYTTHGSTVEHVSFLTGNWSDRPNSVTHLVPQPAELG